MRFRRTLEMPLARHGAINLRCRDLALFLDTVGNNDRFRLVEEIQHSVVDPLVTGPKFIDAFPQQIRLWSAKFMPQESQPLKPGQALDLDSFGQAVQPIQQRNSPTLLPEEEDFRWWQLISVLMFA